MQRGGCHLFIGLLRLDTSLRADADHRCRPPPGETRPEEFYTEQRAAQGGTGNAHPKLEEAGQENRSRLALSLGARDSMGCPGPNSQNCAGSSAALSQHALARPPASF